MKKNIATLFGFISLASGSIWIGAYIARLLVIYQMFEPTELILKSYINQNNLTAIYETILPLYNLTFFAYIVLIISFTAYLLSTELKFRQNGWLFIITMIIYLTLPFEIILLTIDYKIILLFLNQQFGSDEILSLITERITRLSSFPIILVLSFLTIPFFLVAKPFTMIPKNEN